MVQKVAFLMQKSLGRFRKSCFPPKAGSTFLKKDGNKMDVAEKWTWKASNAGWNACMRGLGETARGESAPCLGREQKKEGPANGKDSILRHFSVKSESQKWLFAWFYNHVTFKIMPPAQAGSKFRKKHPNFQKRGCAEPSKHRETRPRHKRFT